MSRNRATNYGEVHKDISQVFVLFKKFLDDGDHALAVGAKIVKKLDNLFVSTELPAISESESPFNTCRSRKGKSKPGLVC